MQAIQWHQQGQQWCIFGVLGPGNILALTVTIVTFFVFTALHCPLIHCIYSFQVHDLSLMANEKHYEDGWHCLDLQRLTEIALAVEPIGSGVHVAVLVINASIHLAEEVA